MKFYTPSPWKVCLEPNLKINESHGEIRSKKYLIATVDCRYGAIGEPEDNARLIAAAPEMLEALKFIVEQMSSPANANQILGAYIHGAGFDMAKKAIAKAEGK